MDRWIVTVLLATFSYPALAALPSVYDLAPFAFVGLLVAVLALVFTRKPGGKGCNERA